jgi:hypothetical protein
VPELDGVRDLHSTAYFSYLLRKDGTVHVWGKHKHSRLGDVSAPRPLPSPVRVKQLAASGEVVSMLTESGEAWALVDAFVSPDPGEAGEIVSGAPELLRTNVAALSSPWGTSLLAMSGEPLVRAGPDWVTVPGVSRAPFIADGVSTSCAPVARAIECWGSDGKARFTLHASSEVVGLAVSAGNVYAVGADGHVEVSWSSTTPRQLAPIAGVTDVVELSAGAGTLAQPLCARFRDKTIGCWAVGEARRVGSGTPGQRLEPALLRRNEDASQPNRSPPENH